MAALVVPKEKEEEVLLLLQQEGGGAGMDINLPLSGDHDVHAHSYVALGDHGIVERENKGRITRSLLDSDEAGELPSSSHDVQQLFQKSGRTRVLMLLLLAFFGCVAALLLVSVGVGSSDVGSQKEVVETREFSNTSFTPALALVTDTSQKGVIPYPSRRTAFHLRPEKNWISDPCGPVYYKGYYHIFYQYNRDGAYWGNMSWGHSASKDLMQWVFLGTSLEPSEWYDIKGSWSGSITMLDGVPTVMYTGCSKDDEQLQALAYPADLSDPLLRKWTKFSGNPVLRAPPTIPIDVFRDPSSGWIGGDGKWRMSIGSRLGREGLALLYTSVDFVHWKYIEKPLFSVAGTGMWECFDFYPLAPLGKPGLNDSVHGPGIKHLLKASLQDDRHDWYGLGQYNTEADTFIPDDPANPIGLRYNYGKFFASKSFFDPVKQRRIIWGFINESDPEANDIVKGWNTVLGIPRTVWLDGTTNANIIQIPAEEINNLRGEKVSKNGVQLPPGTLVQVAGAVGDQLDIEIVFDYPDVSKVSDEERNVDEHFRSELNSQAQGTFGPFGLLVLADKELQEQSAVFFYLSHSKKLGWTTQFYSDPARSTLAKGIDTSSYGAVVTVLPSEDFLSARILVDRTVIESFVQGGRMTMNTRSYPTVAYDRNALVFLFNNGTKAVNVRSLEIWQMQTCTNLSI